MTQHTTLTATPNPNHANGQACISDPLLVNGAPALPQVEANSDLRIHAADWDALYEAVINKLQQTVGEDLQHPPEVAPYCAALKASLIQAVVLDCVAALEQLHTALKQERSQRLTP